MGEGKFQIPNSWPPEYLCRHVWQVPSVPVRMFYILGSGFQGVQIYMFGMPGRYAVDHFETIGLDHLHSFVRIDIGELHLLSVPFQNFVQTFETNGKYAQ